jgi:hypothetical protein
MKGVTKAVLARMTNVEAGRYKGATFTPRFMHGALWAGRKVLNPQRGGLLARKYYEETRENEN